MAHARCTRLSSVPKGPSSGPSAPRPSLPPSPCTSFCAPPPSSAASPRPHSAQRRRRGAGIAERERRGAVRGAEGRAEARRLSALQPWPALGCRKCTIPREPPACAAAPRSLQTLARAGSFRAASGRSLQTLGQNFSSRHRRSAFSAAWRAHERTAGWRHFLQALQQARGRRQHARARARAPWAAPTDAQQRRTAAEARRGEARRAGGRRAGGLCRAQKGCGGAPRAALILPHRGCPARVVGGAARRHVGA